MAGYSEGTAVVMKFRRGLSKQLHDMISLSLFGRPSDDSPEEWYEAAVQCASAQAANLAFHESLTRVPDQDNSLFRSAHIPMYSESATTPSGAPEILLDPVSMDIDAVQMPICERCRKQGHLRLECPWQYDVRHMSKVEMEEWMQKSREEQGGAEPEPEIRSCGNLPPVYKENAKKPRPTQ